MGIKTEQLKKPEPKQVLAHANSLRIAPRKLRLVANMVRNMRAEDALVQLQFTNKRGAIIVSKLIKSAVANAENNFSLSAGGLVIKSITCDAASVMKRYLPRARGSSSPLNRRMSHLHVALEFHELPTKKQGRFSRLIKTSKETRSVQPEVATEVVDDAGTTVQPKFIKTAEQTKQARVQQKRRLFNRRTGE